VDLASIVLVMVANAVAIVASLFVMVGTVRRHTDKLNGGLADLTKAVAAAAEAAAKAAAAAAEALTKKG
jgi:hypothetical protein